MLTHADIRGLLSQPEADQTLSLYLKVDPALPENHAVHPAWQIWMRNSLRETSGHHHDSKALQACNRKASEFFETYHAQSKGLAVFFTPSSLKVFELPVPLSENFSAFGSPAIGPLLWLLDEYERYMLVLVDSEKARFLSGYMGRTAIEDARYLDLDEYDFPQKTQMPAGDRSGGNNRDSFAATVGDHVRRFHREVADYTGQLLQETKAKRIILGGSEEAAYAVKALMHDTVAQAVIAVAPIPMWTSPAAVKEQALSIALAHERASEMALVEETIDFAKAGGRGALGLEATRQCLEQRQVETLLLSWPVGSDSAATGEPLLARAVQAGAAIELLSGPAAERLQAEGGVAARLFYAPVAT